MVSCDLVIERGFCGSIGMYRASSSGASLVASLISFFFLIWSASRWNLIDIEDLGVVGEPS